MPPSTVNLTPSAVAVSGHVANPAATLSWGVINFACVRECHKWIVA